MKFRGGPAAVIGDVGDKATSQPLAGSTLPGRCLQRTIREPEDLLDLIHEGRNPMERISARPFACRRPSLCIGEDREEIA